VLPITADVPGAKSQGITQSGLQDKPQNAATTITPMLKLDASKSSAEKSPEPARASPQEQKKTQSTDSTDTLAEGATGQVSTDQSQNTVLTEQIETDLPEPKQIYYYKLKRSH
jgi:hypothetical protein